MNKENLVELPLDEILKNNGYFEKREKSSQNYKTLTNNNSDTIIITRKSNGHYLYFNPSDDNDRGNIYNFAKNRGVSIKDLIDENIINDVKTLKNNTKEIIKQKENDSIIVEKFKKLNKIDENSFLTSKRKIKNDILIKFSSLKQDEKFKNAIVPTYTLSVLELSSGKREFLKQTGYISYLSKPLTQDQQGKAYAKPIKQLCNGIKGLEILKADEAHKNPKDFKNIVICESMIDTLSYCEMKDVNLKETLLCSTNGQISATQKEVIKALTKLAPNAGVVLGFDNDKPILKDFNDDLVAGTALGISSNKINLDSITKPLKEFSRQVEYLSKKYDFLDPDAKKSRIKDLYALNIEKFREIEPKIKTLQGMRESYKRLNLINTKIEKDYERSSKIR